MLVVLKDVYLREFKTMKQGSEKEKRRDVEGSGRGGGWEVGGGI